MTDYDQIRFSFGDRELVGQVVAFQPDGNVEKINPTLIVDVSGQRYRVKESDAEAITSCG